MGWGKSGSKHQSDAGVRGQKEKDSGRDMRASISRGNSIKLAAIKPGQRGKRTRDEEVVDIERPGKIKQKKKKKESVSVKKMPGMVMSWMI